MRLEIYQEVYGRKLETFQDLYSWNQDLSKIDAEAEPN